MNPSKYTLLLTVSAVAALSLTVPVIAQDQKEHGGHEARPAMSESKNPPRQSDSRDQEGRNDLESKDTAREGPDSQNRSEDSDRKNHDLERAEDTSEAKQDHGRQGDASREGHDRHDVSMFFSDLERDGSWLKHGDFESRPMLKKPAAASRRAKSHRAATVRPQLAQASVHQRWGGESTRQRRGVGLFIFAPPGI
jgi:hypothetical protein